MKTLIRKRAFTLIEILVVIGIIALLSAILFPVLSRAREKARTTTCMNNERQIALAISQYTQDNGRRFPTNSCYEADGSQKSTCDSDGWTAVIGINTAGTFQCPSEGDNDPATDYWLNSELMGFEHEPGLHDVRLRFPANTILIGDGPGAQGMNSNMGPKDPSDPALKIEWDANGDYTKRHSEGANYAFADGHVKWLRPEAINTVDAASGNNFAFRVK